MLNDLQPLPVAVSAREGESGLGFLLRCSHSNGVTLSELANYAGAPSIRWMTTRDAEAFAFLAGVSPEWLITRLKYRRHVDRRRRYSFLGWDWGSVASLRVKHAQVCPECLQESMSCKAEWEVAAAPACPVHQTMLIDRCPHCGIALSWQRPAVEICCCGRYLRRSAASARPSARILAWCSAMKGRLERNSAAVVAGVRTCALPSWLNHISPDGASRLIHAFGVLSRPGERMSSARAVEVPSPDEMAVIVERGLARVGSMLGQLSEEIQTLRLLVYEPGLLRLAKQGVEAADQETARQLLKMLDGGASDPLRHGPRRGGRPAKGQLELFDRVEG